MPDMPFCSAATAAPATAMDRTEATTIDFIFISIPLRRVDLRSPRQDRPEIEQTS
jgi:hypothetical protein